MGHTLHHEVWGPRLFTSLCVGADIKLFSDTLASDFCKWWPVIEAHALPDFSDLWAGRAIQFWGVCALAPKVHSATPDEATLFWMWSRIYPWIVPKG